MGFLHRAELPNCHTTSALCNSSGFRFSAQTRQVTIPFRTKIPSSCPGGSGCAPKAEQFPAGAAGISPGQLGRSERLQGSGSVHISGLPLRVSRVPLALRPRGAAGSSSQRPRRSVSSLPSSYRGHRGRTRSRKSQPRAGHTTGFPGRCQRTAPASFQPPASISNRKGFQSNFQGVLGLARTWRGHHHSQAPGGLFPCSVGENLNSEIHRYRRFIH